MKSSSSAVDTLAVCPACKQPISARYTYEVELDGFTTGTSEVTAKATVTGVVVSHDCTPRATRG